MRALTSTYDIAEQINETKRRVCRMQRRAKATHSYYYTTAELSGDTKHTYLLLVNATASSSIERSTTVPRKGRGQGWKERIKLGVRGRVSAV